MFCIGNKTHGPMYGVDPNFGRTIDIDLSKERMQRAWDAYKIRWEREEGNRRALEEKKLVRNKNPPILYISSRIKWRE